MKARLLTGLPMAAATLLLLWWDYRRGGDPWGLWTLYTVGLVWGMREFVKLQAVGGVLLPMPLMCGLTAILCSAHVLELWKGRPLGPAGSPLPDALLVVAMILLMCGEVVRGEPARFRHLAVAFLGLFYIWVLGHFSMRLRALPAIGGAAFLWYIAAGKFTDAFAYFTGRAFGRTKLIPKVSPGKTWEGLAGGLVLGCAMGWMVWRFTNLRAEIPLRFFIPLTLVVQVAGQFGDLVESLMKRSVEAKDSAKLLPGLGGVLDVIDCLLLSAPVAYYGLVVVIRLKG